MLQHNVIKIVANVASPLNFAAVGSNRPLYYIPVTISNSQSTPTVANMSQLVITAPNDNSSYFSSKLQNANWQDGKGNILASWLESGESNTSIYTIYWINLGSNIIPANKSITLYQVLYATSATSVMDGVNTGAEPTLFTSTYGDLDNGSSVFNYYTNFAGSSLPTGWVAEGINNTLYTVNNGITFTNAADAGIQIALRYTTQQTAPMIIDSLLTSITRTAGGPTVGPFATTTTTLPVNNNDFYESSYMHILVTNLETFTINKFNSSGVGGSVGSVAETSQGLQPSNAMPISLLWNATGDETAYVLYVPMVSTTSEASPITFGNYYVGLGMQGGAHGRVTSWQWFRTRLPPPNKIMPQVIPLQKLDSAHIATQTSIIPTNFFMHECQVTPDGTQLYVTTKEDVHALNIYDIKTTALLKSIDMGVDSKGITFTNDGLNAWVCQSGGLTVKIVNVASQTITNTISGVALTTGGGTGFGPRRTVFSPGGNTAYVTCENDGAVTVIDVPSLTVTNRILLTDYTFCKKLILVHGGLDLYVTCYDSVSQGSGTGGIEIINCASQTVTGHIDTTPQCYDIFVTPDGTKAYSTDFYASTIANINVTTNTKTGTISGFTGGSSGITITDDGSTAYINGSGNNFKIYAVNVATNTIIGSFVSNTGHYSANVVKNPSCTGVYSPMLGAISVLTANPNISNA